MSIAIWWVLLGFTDFGDLGREEHHQNVEKKKASWNLYHDSSKEFKIQMTLKRGCSIFLHVDIE